MTIPSRYAAMVLSILLLGACASSPEGQPEAAMANAQVANPDEVTCRTKVKTGTRIGTKVCKTNRAWALGNRAGRNMAEDIQRKSMQNQTISGQ
jgi:hypothetical protein